MNIKWLWDGQLFGTLYDNRDRHGNNTFKHGGIMKHFRTVIFALLITVFFSVSAFAGNTHSGRAAKEAGKASSHASASSAHAIAGSGQITSAASAFPLFVSGAAGAVSAEIATDLMEAATAPAGAPLVITDEAVTAGPSPADALKE
jgi:hypothetical protein